MRVEYGVRGSIVDVFQRVDSQRHRHKHHQILVRFVQWMIGKMAG
jgi:hypothetical protein